MRLSASVDDCKGRDSRRRRESESMFCVICNGCDMEQGAMRERADGSARVANAR
jgi:hypothetical protein